MNEDDSIPVKEHEVNIYGNDVDPISKMCVANRRTGFISLIIEVDINYINLNILSM